MENFSNIPDEFQQNLEINFRNASRHPQEPPQRFKVPNANLSSGGRFFSAAPYARAMISVHVIRPAIPLAGMAFTWLFFALGAIHGEQQTEDPALLERARRLATNLLLLDSHIDAPIHMANAGVDITGDTDRQFDYPKARAGGLDAAFMAIYVAPDFQEHGAREEADRLLQAVYSVVSTAPEQFALARHPEEIRQKRAAHTISLPLGMENGAPLEGDLEHLHYFYERGIRYITLTHSKDNHICDSSYDSSRTWNGLSPFGKRLIPAMNRIGMMIDVSHVSDATFDQVLALSRAPVIASHSSCRAFLPGLERNLSDDMIRRLVSQGGIIQINFGSYFISQEYREQWDRRQDIFQNFLDEHRLEEEDEAAAEFLGTYDREHPLPEVPLERVADHIDHVVELAGASAAGIGSDFDGVPSLPQGLQNASQYPNLIAELLRRGYQEKEIAGICGENFLRVWEAINRAATSMQKSAS